MVSVKIKDFAKAVDRKEYAKKQGSECYSLVLFKDLLEKRQRDNAA